MINLGKQGLFIGISLLIVIVVICGAVYVLTKSEEDRGLTGNFNYSASGYNADETEIYSGSWELEFKNGKIVNSNNNVIKTIVPKTNEGSNSISFEKNKIKDYVPGGDRPTPSYSFEKDLVKMNNSMINGTYYGSQYITTNFGSLNLREYLITFNSEQYWCYCDNGGIIYFLKGYNSNIFYTLMNYKN